MKRNFFVVLVTLAISSCTTTEKAPLIIGPNDLHKAMQDLSDVIVHDIFSPPVASRVYAYPSIAAYEILAAEDSAYVSLAGQLNGLEKLPAPKGEIHYGLAALVTFYSLSADLIFSEDMLDTARAELRTRAEASSLTNEIIENSYSYADEVRKHITKWMDEDGYKKTRTMPKYSISGENERWVPTPPAYMEAIEPHWNQIRPFVLDSSSQFAPPRPTNYSEDKDTPFFQEIMEVYETGKSLTTEQKEIAQFWDCNPYVMNVKGHVMFATKKITPGGHWIGIVKIACMKNQSSLIESAATYAMVSVALADGFISCWDEKYRSNLVRPETVINKYIDEEWLPLLQTPPFPEYTSGHSVISSAAGTVLTSIFGDNFSFVDSTETRYGLPSRSFNSFKEAYSEAAISRLYGGIHYMPAITNGVTQGTALGNFVVERIKLFKAK